jgi:hypothetical protein
MHEWPKGYLQRAMLTVRHWWKDVRFLMKNPKAMSKILLFRRLEAWVMKFLIQASEINVGSENTA